MLKQEDKETWVDFKKNQPQYNFKGTCKKELHISLGIFVCMSVERT